MSSSMHGSQMSSHDDVSDFVPITTDSDGSAPSQQGSSNSSYYLVTNSNHDNSDMGSPQRVVASRIRIAYSNRPTSTNDCLVSDSNHGNRNQSLTEQSMCGYGDNIKRRLRNHSNVKNGHRVCMGRNSTGSFVRCILSISDSEQSDVDFLPSCGSYPSSSSHAHTAVDQANHKPQYKTSPVAMHKSRRTKRRHNNKTKRGKKKRRKLQRRLLHNIMATPTGTSRRARTVATSPRVIAAADTPQSAIRRLAKARCQAGSLEEARRMSETSRMTQNDIIAHHVRSRQQRQMLWWDSKITDCYKSNSKVVCSPLKNVLKRHPSVSTASLK